MSSLLDTEEEGKTSEITLSTTSLLSIFFGLVLICGVFFGFGYSMGRGTERGAQAIEPGSVATANDAQPSEMTPAENTPPSGPVSPERQDSTQAPAPTGLSASGEGAKPDTAPPDVPGTDAPAASSRAVTSKPDTVLQAAVDSSATGSPYTRAAASGSGQPMVQIAAVARPEDANVLVSALRQRGYGVTVRSEPQDKLLHVQVGPFADRTEAAVIKQKLLSDGYNAIIK